MGIIGCHTMFYSSQPTELREFIRDKLGFPCTDVGGGWLIFRLPESEMGVHPTEGKPPTGTHSISFYCDDIHATVAELKEKGVEFTSEVTDQGYGFECHFKMPGDVDVELYQAKYRLDA